jgi:ribonuclease Z
MPPVFHPVLVNPPTGDPGLFIPLLFQRRAILMDLGDITALPSREILKISHIFISHTHMDHFAGFDRLLRILLGRDKTVALYGPEGFLANLEGKLAGYSWNLLDNYENCLTLEAMEISEDALIRRQYLSRKKFSPGPDEASDWPQRPLLHEEPSFSVYGTVLDHRIPVLGFSVEEKFTINIRKDALERMDLCPGPWLQEFKQALYADADPDCLLQVPAGGVAEVLSEWRLGDLAHELAIISKGQKIAYICDAGYSDSNREKIIEMVSGADHLFIEAAFLEKDAGHARRKHHLTARQAGEIAAAAGVRRYTLFHFSPRYAGMSHCFYEEASKAFGAATHPAEGTAMPYPARPYPGA